MYMLRNGILHCDGKPEFVLGLSYYASYHPQKFPVLPEDDRIGEMRKDINGMREAGFNLIRVAALGKLWRDGRGVVEGEFPLADSIVKCAEENGMATVVRLQGYITNLSDHQDAEILNEKGEKLKQYQNFFMACPNHDGIRRDEEEACLVSAEHFKELSSVVGFQIYNEPAYPPGGFYDYNPCSIQCWRDWLVESGLKTVEEAKNCEPPRRRPYYDESCHDWVHWRLFNHERLSCYLNNLSDKAKQGHANADTMTCLTIAPLCPGNALAGVDFFRVAEGMDVLGITHYIPSFGTRYYQASEVYDMAESSAALFGKHAWVVEANASTKIKANEWERATYSIVGSGLKGILYYQWRGDYPFSDSPEPECYGMLFNDGRKTSKFERAVAMNRLVGKLGTLFAGAEKRRSGVALLVSEHANAWYDARDNRGVKDPCSERIVSRMLFAYREFRKAGVVVDFIRAADLASNPLNCEVLIVPAPEALSEKEKSLIDSFRETGGTVCSNSLSDWAGNIMGFDIEGIPCRVDHACWHQSCFDAENVLRKAGVEVLFRIERSQIDVKILEGCDEEGQYMVICLVNFDPLEEVVPAGAALWIENVEIGDQVEFFSPNCQVILDAEKTGKSLEIILPEITTGGFIVVR